MPDPDAKVVAVVMQAKARFCFRFDRVDDRLPPLAAIVAGLLVLWPVGPK
jgi:hypothetical protein